MLNKRDVTKLLKQILRRQRGLRDHQIIHPRRDWTIGLLIGAILLVAGATWSFVTFQDVGSRTVQNAITEPVQPTLYRADVVNSALEIFRARQANYEVLLENGRNNNVVNTDTANSQNSDDGDATITESGVNTPEFDENTNEETTNANPIAQ